MTANSHSILLVKKILSQLTGRSVIAINDQDRLVWELGLDSVEIIDFLLQLEAEGIFLPDEKINGEMSVMDISEAINF